MLIWIIFAVVTALCLAVVLVPLARASTSKGDRSAFDVEIYRDQLKQLDRDVEAGVLVDEDAEGARLEVSRRLLAAAPDVDAPHNDRTEAKSLAARLATLVVALCVPGIALSIYLSVGSPGLPGQPLVARQEAPAEQQDMQALIVKVEAHLRNNPDDARGWKIIAPAYLAQRRFRDAASAYARSMELQGRDAETLSNYGEALLLAEQGLVTEKARTAFKEATTRDKSQFKAKFYLGLADRQDGKNRSAIAVWEKLLAEGGKDAPWRPVVEAHIEAARVGLTDAPTLSNDQLAATDELSADERNEMVNSMVSRLADRLAEDGSDLAGWLRLARSYVVLNRAEDARAALGKAKVNFAGNEDALNQIATAEQQLGLEKAAPVAEAPQPTSEDVEAAQSMTADERNQMIEGMVTRLAERLKDNGQDLDGWLRLARSYSVLKKSEDARTALKNAQSNFVGNPEALEQIERTREQLGFGEAKAVTEAPQPTTEDVEAAQSMTADERREMIEGMVARLAERLDENGDDIEGWMRLIQSYAVLRNQDAARKALDKAEAQFAGDDEALARIKDARDQLGLNKE